MKHFAIKFAAFLVINVAFVLVFYITNNSFNIYNNASAKSNLLTIPQNKNYDFILLGTSRGRQFSRGGNQRLVEEAIGVNFLNIARPGSGILPEKIYLSYFFQNHNRVKDVVYLIDPFVFYSSNWNTEMTFDDEPFRVTFLLALVRNHFTTNAIKGYISTFLHWPPFTGFESPEDSTSTLKKAVDLSSLKKPSIVTVVLLTLMALICRILTSMQYTSGILLI